jgi:hypothetical protein
LESDAAAIETYHCSKVSYIYVVLSNLWALSMLFEANLDKRVRKSVRAKEDSKWSKILKSKTFGADNFLRILGTRLTLDFCRRTGFRTPVVVEDPEGLDMVMPKDITVYFVDSGGESSRIMWI